MQLIAHAVGGGDDHSVGIGICVDPEHTAAHQNGTCHLRNAKLDDDCCGLWINTEGSWLQLEVKLLTLLPQKYSCCSEGTKLGRRCGNRCACCLHGNHGNQKNVQHNIYSGSYKYENQGSFAFTHATQNANDSIIAKDKRVTQCGDNHISLCLSDSFLRTVKPAENLAGQSNSCCCKHQRDADHQAEQGANGFICTLPITRAGKLRYVNLPRRGQGCSNWGNKISYLTTGVYTHCANVAHKLPNDDHIHHGIELLNQIRQDNRNCKCQQRSHNRPLRQILSHTLSGANCLCHTFTSFHLYYIVKI